MSKIRYKRNRPSPSAWQVWLAYVEFEGNIGGKKRPVLVTGIRGGACSIMEITSRPPEYITDVPIIDLISAGLEKESAVQTRKRRTIHRSSLIDCMGILSAEDRYTVKRASELIL